MSQPARVHPNIRDANEPAHGAMKRAARYEIFQPCGVSTCVQVEVQDLFPHGWKKTQMPLLPRVFLCDLQLDRLVRFLKPAEERRNWFARLKVDWAIFNLDDDVIRKFAVERMKNVVGSFGTIILGIAPIKMVVIDKRPVENDPAVRREGVRDRENPSDQTYPGHRSLWGCLNRRQQIAGRPTGETHLRFERVAEESYLPECADRR